jgi:hypothetical protein
MVDFCWNLLDANSWYQLEPAVRNMIAAHTFVLTNIGGGIWARLLETIAAAPVLTHLVLDDSPWLGKDRDIFDLPFTVGMPLLRTSIHRSPCRGTVRGPILGHCQAPISQAGKRGKKHMWYLAGLPTLPGELVLRSLNSSLGWNSLRELYTEGYWPDPADIPAVHPSDNAKSPNSFAPVPSKLSRRMVPSAPAGTFLPCLQRLEIASLLPGDHLLSLLPSGLENLAVIEYPPLPGLYRYPKNDLTSSAFLDALRGVYLPAVTRLELWYVTDASDQRFLWYPPRTFPSLWYLEMCRFIGPGMDDAWNPGVRA